MSASLNRALLIGNLGRDPEVRTTQAGGRVVSLNIATSENWRDERTGDRVQRTEWHRVVVFSEKLGELAEKYLKKGSKVFVEGQLRTNKWVDKEGVERYTTEIHLSPFNSTLTFLDARRDEDAAADSDEAPPEQAAQGTTPAATTKAAPRSSATKKKA